MSVPLQNMQEDALPENVPCNLKKGPQPVNEKETILERISG